MKNEEKALVKIKPWMGTLGFLGFLGLIFYIVFNDPKSFLFNGLFVFFAFYWMGKLSKELKREKFMYNKMRSADISYKTALTCTIIILINSLSGSSMEGRYQYLIICLPALVSFLIIERIYLIYRYEKETKKKLAG